MANINRMMEWARQHPTATQVGVGALLTLLLKQLVLDKLYGGINEWLGNQAKAFLGEAYEPLMGTLLEYVLPAAVAFTLVFAAYALGRMGLSKNTSGVSSEPDIMAQNPMRWTFLQKRHGFLMGRTTDYGAEILGFQTTGVNKTGKFIKDLGGFVRSERNGKTYGLLIQDGNSRVPVEKLGIPGEHQFHIQTPFFDGDGMPVARFVTEYGQLTFEFQYSGTTDRHVFSVEEVEAEALRIENDLKPKPLRSSAGPVRIDDEERRTENEPIVWNQHLGHSYSTPAGGLRTQAIQITGTVGENGTRLSAASILSRKTGAEILLDVGLPDQTWASPDIINTLPPKAIVTLRASFNPPDGLSAKEIIDEWGAFTLRVQCDRVEYKKIFDKDTVRKLYESFRPSPLSPHATIKDGE